MRKILLASIAALGLTGCAALQAIQSGTNFVVTQNEIDTARNGYDAAFLTPMAHYRQLGFCKTGTTATLTLPCASRAIVAQMISADSAVEINFNTVQALVSSGNATGLSAAFATLQSSITTAESLALTLGVK